MVHRVCVRVKGQQNVPERQQAKNKFAMGGNGGVKAIGTRDALEEGGNTMGSQHGTKWGFGGRRHACNRVGGESQEKEKKGRAKKSNVRGGKNRTRGEVRDGGTTKSKEKGIVVPKSKTKNHKYNEESERYERTIDTPGGWEGR